MIQIVVNGQLISLTEETIKLVPICIKILPDSILIHIKRKGKG